jgi:carboxylesterase
MLSAVLGGLVVAAALATGTVRLRRRALQDRARGFLARFERVSALGAYREGLARISLPGPKRPHAVLLLHGYSASPAALRRLTDALDARGVAYYAPALTGFGLDDFRLLEAVRGEDWRRDAFAAYDVLAAAAEAVSVVALSFSTLVAAELARDRPVRHLVLVAPYFHLQGATDRRMRERFRSPFQRALALAAIPWIAKPVRPGRETCVDLVDPEASRRFFQYPTLPLASLMAVWAYPRDVDFAALRVASLDVLWGEQESTSDVPAFLAALAAAGVPHRARAFPRSAHNLLDDHDGPEAAAAIAEILAPVADGPPPER